jgi:hypothetical protein
MDNKGSAQNFLEERFLLPNLIEKLSDLKKLIMRAEERWAGESDKINKQTHLNNICFHQLQITISAKFFYEILLC